MRGMAVSAEVHDVLDGFADTGPREHGGEHQEQNEHTLDHER
jgi:hypothetical protein